MRNCAWGFFTALLSVLVFIMLPFDLSADILLLDRFDQKLDTTIWTPSDAAAVYTEDGVAVLDQAGSGGDWVNLVTNEAFPDCVIYYQYIFAARSGGGDGGGYLRQNPAGDGGYKIRWGWQGANTVRLTDGVDHPPIAAWSAFPGLESNFPATTTRFEFKASLVTPNIKVHIIDLDRNELIAEWELEDDWYESGMLEFDNYIDGIYHIDNVIVATPDMEEIIFSEKFDPETMEAAVNAANKLATTWSKIKSQ
jgi:hypothetical protein